MGEKRKYSLRAISRFPSVFSRLVLQTRENKGLFGKEDFIKNSKLLQMTNSDFLLKFLFRRVENSFGKGQYGGYQWDLGTGNFAQNLLPIAQGLALLSLGHMMKWQGGAMGVLVHFVTVLVITLIVKFCLVSIFFWTKKIWTSPHFCIFRQEFKYGILMEFVSW